MSLVDSATFSPGHPGGGNLGIAIDVMTIVDLRWSPRDDGSLQDGSIEHSEPAVRQVAQHVLQSWRRVHGINFDCAMAVISTAPEHVGLASWSALQAAILMGLNVADSGQRDCDRLLRHHSANYIEFAHGGIVPGFTTGLQMLLAGSGGFGYIDTDLENHHRSPLPPWNVCLAIPTELGTSQSNDDESKVLLGAARTLDRSDAPAKREIIRTEVLPAVSRKSLPEIGAAVERLQSLGSKRAEVAARGSAMVRRMAQLREAGIECVYMSSLGPGVITISEMSLGDLREILTSCEMSCVHTGQVYNRPNHLDDIDTTGAGDQ